jgi:hypothetical protein
MNPERQEIYKGQLVSLIRGLSTSRNDPKQRAMFGNIAGKLINDSKAGSWAEFKKRVSGKGYDSVLAGVEAGIVDMKRKGQPLGVRAMEGIALALIGRHNTDPELDPVLEQLDTYIEACLAVFLRVQAKNAPETTEH